MKYFSLVLFVQILLLSSCSNNLKYFTTNLHRQYNWSEKELHAIQFYVSEDIVLYKDLGRAQSRIEDGKIRIRDGRKVEEIVIKKGTPGVFIQSPKKERFAISFESNDESKFLMFGPNKKARGRYVLLAKEWERNQGRVSYGDEVYYTSSSSAYAALMVDMKKATNTRYESREAEGNRVNE